MHSCIIGNLLERFISEERYMYKNYWRLPLQIAILSVSSSQNQLGFQIISLKWS